MRIGECFTFAWETFKQKPSEWIFVTFVLLVASFAAQALGTMLLHGFAIVSTLVVNALVWGGFMSIARKAARGETPTLNDAFWPFQERQGDFIIVSLAGASGLLACGVGVFVTTSLFLFAPLCVVEGGDFRQSLIRSKDLLLPRIAEAIVLLVALIAINLAGTLAFGIGVLVSMPITALMIVKAYEQAAAAPAEAPTIYPTAV